MDNRIERIISFKLSGKFGHFSKFYTNSSSLSYLIPPRTVIIGMLASIMKIPRDEYYELMSEETFKISVRIPRGLVIRKQTHSLNYLHNDYYKLIATDNHKGKANHSQCKLELLHGPPNGRIEYVIYIGGNNDDTVFNELVSCLQAGNYGYGIYLGQRQFKADISDLILYNENDIRFLENSDTVDTLCIKENITDLDFIPDIQVLTDQIPVNFRKIENKGKVCREPISVKDVVFERTGQSLKGKFKNCYILGDNIISFY
jgi:CRISPR-associated protein Cas5h